MKILGISGGMRNGNNDGMCKEALMAAKAKGAEVSFISLQDLNIKHCTGCTACVQNLFTSKGGKCVLKDDFEWLLDKMLDADGIILSTPIFEKGVTGLVHTLTDRFGPRLDRGCNVVATKIAEQTGGQAPDSRILKDKVISFMSIGGSGWSELAQCDCAMLALSPMWKVINNELFTFSSGVLAHDESLERARDVGENIVEAAKDIEKAKYQGDPGVCPHCHSRNFYLRDQKATCCLCGIEGIIENNDGKYTFSFDAEQISHAHNTLSGKLIHVDELKVTTPARAEAIKSEKNQSRQPVYKQEIPQFKPER